MLEEKINVLIVALHYYDSQEKKLLRVCKNGVSAAHHTLLNNLIKGLKAFSNVTILSSLPVGSFPCMTNHIVFPSCKREDGYEIGFINLPFIKDYIRQRAVKREILKWYNEQKNKNECYVLVYDSLYYLMQGAVDAKKIANEIKNVLIVPDLPGEYSVENKNYNKLIECGLKFKANKFFNIVKEFDAFIPLSKHMMNAMKVDDKPYLVVECIVKEVKDHIPQIAENPVKKLMYAGELSKIVNVDLLLDAIEKIDNCQLYICGRGPLEDYIKKKSETNHRIHYLGFIPKKELEIVEKGIDIFINPRQNIGKYTKYSFPSKNAEYLLTGKPLVAYKLDGIPTEYGDFIYSPEDNSIDALAKTISRVLTLDYDTLLNMGIKQIEFMQGKSSVAQGKRIVNFLKNLNK